MLPIMISNLRTMSVMLWLQPITTKAPEEVYKKFVENFLLEEGAPQFILTDRGTEFKARAAGAQSYLEDYTLSVFRDGENGGSRVASRAAVRDCESVTELLSWGLHSGWAGPPVSSVGDHSPRDLSVLLGSGVEGPDQGHPKIR